MNTLETPETTSYAAQVRAALADLSAEEIEELTGGLEADLAESWVDNAGQPLIDPVAYAAELRQAAGLPVGQRQPGAWSRATTKWKHRWAVWVAGFQDLPGGKAVVDYIVALRPAWWFLRAWLAYQLFAAYTIVGRPELIPGGPIRFLVLIAFIAGSVWLGKQNLKGFLRALVILGNIAAVIVLLTVSAFFAPRVEYIETEPYYDDMVGLYSNGEEVTNLFGYDAEGNLLEQFQLFDQNGNPIITSVEGGNGCLTWVLDPSRYEEDDGDCAQHGLWVSSQLETGAQAWNVFPMRMVETGEISLDEPVPGAMPMNATPPFIKVPALDILQSTDGDSDTTAEGKTKSSKKSVRDKE